MKQVRYLAIIVSLTSVLATAQNSAPGQPTDRTTGVLATITFQTNPSGLTVIVDGTSHTTPYQTSWTKGTVHTINTTSPQSGGAGTQYVFSSWSDGGAQEHSVTAPTNNRTYTASFTTQYYLTMSASPSTGGAVSPSSGWRNKGQSVAINATANSGFSFASWSGTGTGSYTGTTKSTTITMNGPINEVGNFSVLVQPVLSVSPDDRQVSSSSGTTTFGVSNTGTGTLNWTATSNQSWATITGGASGTNTGTISVSYTENPSVTDSRIATISVTAPGATGSPRAVTITQDPTSPPVLIPDTISVSDDFSAAALDATLWTIVDPLGGTAVSVASKQLSIAVPGGVNHEPWTSGNSAPRVMQTVVPSMNSCAWIVKFNSLPTGSTSTIPMQGLLFEQDAANYIRTDIFGDGTNVYVFAAGFINGPTDPKIYFNVQVPATSAPIWLHVIRSGAIWRVYCSLDGLTSSSIGSFNHSITLNRVGVFAGNSGTSPEPFTCLVDYVQAALPAKTFLVTPGSGANAVPRPVVFSWDGAAGATAYRLQVAIDSTFATRVFDSLVVGTSKTINAFPPNTQKCWWRVAGKNSAGWGQYSDVRWFIMSTSDVAQGENFPDRYTLEQNYPNPFNPSTTIRYGLPHHAHVTLTVFTALGQKVAELVNEEVEAGYHEVKFDGSALSSGVYVYRMQAGNAVQVRKLLLVR
jgi:hypothetical protein